MAQNGPVAPVDHFGITGLPARETTALRKLIADLIRQPLVHFVVLGAMLGIALHWTVDDGPRNDETTIRITATDVARLDAGWRSRWNRAPTPEELNGLIEAQVREVALHREALALGLDQDEPVIRRVLVQKLEGIVKDLIELSLAPTDQDLERYYRENAERYRPPALITFTQVFVDPDRREERTLEDADEILAELRSRGRPVGNIEEFGDPFMLQRYFPEKDEQRIASLFGAGFARSVFELAPGEWHGPVPSGYGAHLVYVDARREFPIPPLPEIRERVTQDWVDDNRREITDRYFAELLARYDVVVEGPSGERPIEVEPATGT